MSEVRLIDANALKEDLRRYFTDGVLDGVSAKLAFNQILHDIDNAPVVSEITKEKLSIAYDQGYEDGKNNWLQEEKPQAEWVYSKEKIQFVCSNCGEIPTKFTGCSLALYYLNKYYCFCRNCGAKMKGGTE